MQNVKIFFQSFIPAFFCFSLMIMAAVLWVSPVSQPQNAPMQSYLSLPSADDSLTLLAIHAEDTLRSLTLLSIQPQSGQILLHTFPPNTVINGENLSEAWKQKNLSSLKSLISAYSKLGIQRTLLIDDRRLFAMLKQFAPISAVLEESLHYTQSGLTVTLEPGMHRLNAEQCLYYLNNAETPSLYARRCEELLQNAINEHWSMMATSQAQETFLHLLDLCDTDLSVSDFDRHGDACSFLAQMVERPAIIQQNAAS